MLFFSYTSLDKQKVTAFNRETHIFRAKPGQAVEKQGFGPFQLCLVRDGRFGLLENKPTDP
jgi:hypothetical protein